jgi:hypothetical protein
MGVRVESRRQGQVSFIVKNSRFPGFFVNKRLPLGGGVKTTAVAFLVSSESDEIATRVENWAQTRSQKNPPLEKLLPGRVRLRLKTFTI